MLSNAYFSNAYANYDKVSKSIAYANLAHLISNLS